MTTIANSTQSSANPDETTTISIKDFDFERAKRENWTLSDLGRFKDGSPHVELQRIDKPPVGGRVFFDDKAAWGYVVAQARAGSLFHRQALDLVDRRERLGIETLHGTW
jgi:hypothetical protein